MIFENLTRCSKFQRYRFSKLRQNISEILTQVEPHDTNLETGGSSHILISSQNAPSFTLRK